jgi:putative two-component system response regulator
MPYARIVVIDDEPVNIKVVQRLLQIEGYQNFVSTSDSREALTVVRAESPDLVLLDLMMPHVSGLEILASIRADINTLHTPVIVLTASTDRDTRIEALSTGANDFLNKPIDPSELVPRVANLLALKRQQDCLEDYSRQLELAVRERTAELEASRRDILHCLARAAEFRDDDTGHHVLRVGRYARLLADALGYDVEYLDLIEQAAQLHDVGKIGIGDDILKKPGRLTEDEFECMRRHSSLGKRVLQRMSPQEELALRHHADIGAKVLGVSNSPVLDMATRIALTHHEWWNGRGYPLGLEGEDIPIEGRITAIADVFDALSTRRCYKEAFPMSKCFEIMEAERGTHFDPALLDAFFTKRAEILEVQMRYADEV